MQMYLNPRARNESVHPVCVLIRLGCQRGSGGRLTRPSSLSSRARTPVVSVNSLTLTTGSGCVVVKSP